MDSGKNYQETLEFFSQKEEEFTQTEPAVVSPLAALLQKPSKLSEHRLYAAPKSNPVCRFCGQVHQADQY